LGGLSSNNRLSKTFIEVIGYFCDTWRSGKNFKSRALDLQKIINGCINGHIRDQEALFKMYSDEMFAVCLYYSPNRIEAEDTLHEGFIKVFQNISSLKGQASIR
jgi:hypothetical protein